MGGAAVLRVEWPAAYQAQLPPLLPRDPFLRAKARRIAAMIATDITPLHSMRVLKAIVTDLGQKPEVLRGWTQRWIGDGFAAVESVIADERGPFCVGDAPTMADAFLVPAVIIARMSGVDLAAFPRIAAVDATRVRRPVESLGQACGTSTRVDTGNSARLSPVGAGPLPK